MQERGENKKIFVKEITLPERTEVITKNFYSFEEIVHDYVESYPQPEGIKDAITIAANTGIWKKLNDLESVDFDKPIVFTGQQPTLGYETSRRLGKRAGAHEKLTTIHAHADHDHAGKNGFTTITMPEISGDLVTYKNFSISEDVDPDTYMSEVKVPLQDDVKRFFDKIISHGKIQGAQNTQVVEDCRQFVFENFDQIRSLAELNAVIQTYIVRRLSPETKTVDLMLSDILDTPLFKEALADFVLDLPQWIDYYNDAAEKVNKIDFPNGYFLPQPLKKSGNLSEVPLWLVDTVNGARTKVWMLNEGDEITIGTHDEDEGKFYPVMHFDKNTSREELVNNDNFNNLSPAAVSLVSILRDRLRLPIIHGKTGHYYEIINEIIRMYQDGYRMQNGNLPYPSSTPLAPVCSVSHEPTTTGREIIVLNISEEKLREKKHLYDQKHKDINGDVQKSYGTTRTIFDQDIENMGLEGLKDAKKIKEGPYIELRNDLLKLISLFSLIKENTTENNSELELPFTNVSTKFNEIADYMYKLSRTIPNLQEIMEIENLASISKFWDNLTNWRKSKDNHKNIANQQRVYLEIKTILQKRIDEILENKKRIPSLIETAMFRSGRISATYKLEAYKVGQENEL